MSTEDDTEAREELRCRVTDVRDHSVMLDPGEGRARFLLPIELVPGEIEVGDRVSVSARHTPFGPSAVSTDVNEIFDEALEALEDLESGWGRPGTAADTSAA